MADAAIAELGDKIATLTLKQAVDLAEYLKETHKIEAAAGGGGGGGGGGGAAAPVAAVEAQTNFDVVLKSSPPDKKIAVIKVGREVKAGLGLAEAKALVEGAPKPLLEGANKADTDAAKKKLEEAGAKVEVK